MNHVASLPIVIALLSQIALTRLQAQVMITEIMFSPIADRGSEYVELFNAGPDSVSLRGAKIVDASGRVQASLPSAAGISVGGRLVIAASKLVYVQFPWLQDSGNVVVLGRSSLGLNADGDVVVLHDRRGATVDSVPYVDEWHRPDLPSPRGIALERISISSASDNSRNWSSSVARNGGTPGAENSVAIEPHVARACLTVDPPVVSPDADGRDDFTRLQWKLPASVAWIMITLHDLDGRLLRRIANNELAGTDGEIIFDGCDAERHPLEPGLYVIHLEAFIPERRERFGDQTTVVVARR